MSKQVIIRQKHREVLKKMSDNVGLTRTEAQREVGYTESYSHGGNIAETDSWQALMKEHIPDSQLLKVEKEGLEATKIHTSHTEPDREVIDYPTRHKYLETGLKLKGKLKDSPEGNKTLIINISGPNAKRFGLTSDTRGSR